LENKFSPGVRWRGEATDGDSFSFLDRESIERLQNISAPEELDGKRDTSTYWTLIGQGEHRETANISAPEELEWESEKRHKYLLNL
jgi:hypothetical protein